MNRKRMTFLVITLLIAMLTSVGCGGDKNPQNSQDPQNPSSPVVTNPPVPLPTDVTGKTADQIIALGNSALKSEGYDYAIAYYTT